MIEGAPQAWLSAARSHLHAARGLRSIHPRSSSSRSYYAAFSAAHAILAHLRPEISSRPRGHFRHGETPGELRWTLLHNAGLELGSFRADFYRESLEDAYNLRAVSDYQPLKSVTAEHAGDAESAAASVVRLAERIVR